VYEAFCDGHAKYQLVGRHLHGVLPYIDEHRISAMDSRCMKISVKGVERIP
jgi:hypothetical protein